MNKKYLSVILFGALMLGTTGTFTSCKDYDDDINNLQEQVDGIKTTLAELQKAIENGKYVTSIVAEGNGLKITMNDGTSNVIENVINGETPKPGDVVTFDAETGEILINGEKTGYYASKDAETEKFKAPYVNDEGILVLIDEEGEEVVTGIRVAPVTAVQNADLSYTLTIWGADGKSQTVEVPSAASVMRDLELLGYITNDEGLDANGNLSVGNIENETALEVNYYRLTDFSIVDIEGKELDEKAPDSWSAQKDVVKKQVLTTLAANGYQLVSRVAPANLDLSSFKFTLQDSKGNTLPIALNPAENFKGALTKAANSSYNLIPLDVTTTTYNDDNSYTRLFKAKHIYSLVDEAGNRSTYGNFTVTASPYKGFENIAVTGIDPEGTTVDDNVGKGTKEAPFIVDLNTPTRFEFTVAEQVYDYYVVPADQNAANEFGFSTDIKAGTITLTKSIDLVTKTGLELYVYALRLDGKIYKIPVWVKPSSIMASDVVLKGGEQLITPVLNNKGVLDANWDNYAYFVLSLDEMFANMTQTDKDRWMSSVTGANAKNPINISDVKNANGNFAGNIAPFFLNAKGEITNNTNAIAMLLAVQYADGTPEKALLTPFTEYSMTISFLHDEGENEEPSVLNTVKATFTPTLPKLSDYMTRRTGLWNSDVLMAYFTDPAQNPITDDDAAWITKKQKLGSIFDMKNGFTKLGWVDKDNTSILDINFALDPNQKLSDNKAAKACASINNNTITLDWDEVKNGKPRAYGVALNVGVSATYLDVYKYADYTTTKAQLTDAAYQINVQSALEAGTVEPVAGASIVLTPSGAAKTMQITAEDIIGYTYNHDASYNLFQTYRKANDKKSIDWAYSYIKEVKFESVDEVLYTVLDADGNKSANGYAIAPEWDTKNNVEIPSYASLKAGNTTEEVTTKIKVTITDWFGYTKVAEVPITIKKATVGE